MHPPSDAWRARSMLRRSQSMSTATSCARGHSRATARAAPTQDLVRHPACRDSVEHTEGGSPHKPSNRSCTMGIDDDVRSLY
mmetsp:Transcript_39149/g.114332  ORF Transcript_39149/g.114332 Transcript_39149/m.114332 type:complete len:82 (-) Transcript_39149:30-275(-)